MKKLLIILVLFLASCCGDGERYEVTYVVFYPNYNDTLTIETIGYPYVFSNRGSNYLKSGCISGSNYYAGSSPFKILKVEKL